MADIVPGEAAPPLTFSQQLDKGEQHWKWKISLRSLLCVLDIIGIGAVAWLLATYQNTDGSVYFDYFNDFHIAPASLTFLIISLLWCLVVILVLLLRRPPRPVHPGVLVGVDLILWMIFVVTGLYTVATAYNTSNFSPDYVSGIEYNRNYSGEYIMAPNNTWVYNITYVQQSDADSYIYNETTGDYQYHHTELNASSVQRDCTPQFASCADQDAFINELWQGKDTRSGVGYLAGACQFGAVIFHFALFVWACVDTNRRNRGRKAKTAEEMAERIIQDMQAKGMLTLHAPANQPLLAPQPALLSPESSRAPSTETAARPLPPATAAADAASSSPSHTA